VVVNFAIPIKSMTSTATQPRISYSDYLEWENARADKNEFVRGEVFAMVGARRVHGEVALNCAALLKTHLAGSGCRAYASDMKIRVEAADAVFYPDVFVTCDARDLATELVFAHPVLVSEVLSESTASYDRGFKFAAYRQLASLVEYMLIDPDRRSVEVFRRGADGLFTLHDFSASQEVHLASVEAHLAMANLFDGV